MSQEEVHASDVMEEIIEINKRETLKHPKKRPSEPKSVIGTIKRHFKENLLLIMTVIAVCIGVGLGLYLRANTNFTPPTKKYFGVPGELFLRALKFLILPLVSTSLITGIAGLGLQKTGKVAARAFIFYFSSTFVAVVIGLILVTTIRPGYLSRGAVTINKDSFSKQKVNTADTFIDLLRNLIPENMIQMTFQLYQTRLEPHYKNVTVSENTNSSYSNKSSFNLSNENNRNKTVQIIDYYNQIPDSRNGLDVLGLVLFCITFGAMLAQIGERGMVMVHFLEILNEVSIKIIRIVMWISPLGIMSLVCVAVLEMEDPVAVFKSISYYMMTVFIGLGIQGLIFLPTVYIILTRKNVLKFGKNMSEALLVALATASSAATLPITFKCIEEKNKVSKMISRFVLPVGATINLDGTALYEAVASIFIAQLNGINLSFVDLVVTSITATLASIGAAGIPSAGLVTMIIVLSALNIPADQISLIYAVDWFLDRFRTMINVWGDSIATGVVAHLSAKEVAQYEEEQKVKRLNATSGDNRESKQFLEENLRNENETLNI
ncbi:excitatory amino acid transporter 3 [Brachionus plicatilis]|uniref:Amino acid transporter n=1 Tax=Brachionus plicatilis TaxID=10195 RepID=A0A3M7SWR7_BRAPC|nr:excitatory amino acid transporter 3 [Brachionus plicatilis]